MAYYNDPGETIKSGGDFATIQAFEGAYDGVDISGTDGVLGLLEGTDGTSSASIYILGWTTALSDTCRFVVKAQTNFETDGDDGDGTTNARIVKTFSVEETTNSIFADIIGIEFVESAAAPAIIAQINWKGHLRIAKCLIRDSTFNGAAINIGAPAAASIVEIGGCIIKDEDTANYGMGVYSVSSANLTLSIINCTIIRSRWYGINIGANCTGNVYNCAVESTTGTDISGADNASNNLVAGAVSITDGTDFVDPTAGNDNFRVVVDGALYGAGTSIAASWFTTLCATDLDGNAWGATPSVGCFEYVAAGGGGWTGKICGVTDPSKICGVAVADITKVCGV